MTILSPNNASLYQQNSQILTRSSSQKAKIQTRAMVKSVESRKPNAALLEAKRRAKNLKMLEQEQIVEPVKDVFSKVRIFVKIQAIF